MDHHVITVADLIQILLMVGACYACYIKGKISGVTELAQILLDKEKITLQDLEDLPEE